MVIKCPAWTWVWSNIILKTNIRAGSKLINNFLQFLKPWKGSNGSHELMTIFIQIQPPELFYKKELFHNVSQNFAIFTRKHLYWSLFLINSQTCFYEYYKTFKNTYFEKHLRMAASVYQMNVSKESYCSLFATQIKISLLLDIWKTFGSF